MDERDIRLARNSIELLKEHEPVLIQKHNNLGRMLGVKKQYQVCISCQDTWPCYMYTAQVERVVENLSAALDDYETLRKSFDLLAMMQAESSTRITMATDMLRGRATTNEANIDQQ